MPLVAGSVADLARSPELRVPLDWFRRERAWINEQHLKLCRVAAPTFLEQKRAEWMAERFRELGWESRLDRSGNVVASLPGRRESPTVAVTAHLDTVLAPRSSDEIKLSGDGRFLGPGVSDNGAGLAALLAIAAAWNAAPPLPDAQLAPVLIANVGEEGEGNLSGMRYLCRDANVYVQTVLRDDLVRMVPSARFVDTIDYHSTVVQAAQTAARANVGTLVLTHQIPTPAPGSPGGPG